MTGSEAKNNDHQAQSAGPQPFKSNDILDPENLDEALNSVPLFMRNMPKEEDMENNVALAALQSLAYDGTPDEVALNFKEQGNDAYRAKDFINAKKYYTQALAQEFQDDKLRSTLLTNRAACNLEMKNYRATINDCAGALSLGRNNVKALFRSAKACYSLEKMDEAIECCDWALKLDPKNASVEAFRTKAIARKEELAEMERKRKVREAKRKEERKMLAEAIKIRNLKFVTRASSGEDEDTDSDGNANEDEEEEKHPWENNSGKQVKLDAESGHLKWPVFFLYPEHKESDFIEEFDEATTIKDQIDTVLQMPAPWDNGPKPLYTPNTVDVYFLHRPPNGLENDETLTKIGSQAPLATILSHPKFQIVNGIPNFIVLQKSGEFREKFLDVYRKRRLAQEKAKQK